MKKIKKAIEKILIESNLEKGYRPRGTIDRNNPPRGGSGVPPKIQN